jgi:TRAP-type transport system small permease protein
VKKEKLNFAKLLGYIDKALVVWCVCIMGLMCLMVISSVFLRYVFNLAFVWSEELIILLFITTTYFGAVLCVRENEHIDIRFLRECVPEKAGQVLNIIITVICIIVQVALAYISLEWIQRTGSSITVGLKIPYTYIYSIFPVSFISMAIYRGLKVIKTLEQDKKDRGGVIRCQ